VSTANTGNGIVDLTAKNQTQRGEYYADIDFSTDCGPIKPLHGINNSPVRFNGVLTELLDAGIPFVRLHDTGGAFGGTYLVDTAGSHA